MISFGVLVTVCVAFNIVTPIYTQQQKWYHLSNVFDNPFKQTISTESYKDIKNKNSNSNIEKLNEKILKIELTTTS